jgi:hypothetical protein
VRCLRHIQKREQYQRLIRDFPKSKLVSDAYLAMGEMRFADGDWKGADKFYAILRGRQVHAATLHAHSRALSVGYSLRHFASPHGNSPQ